MDNIVEDVNNGSEIFDNFLLQNIEISGCNLVETLEKNIEVLRSEAHQVTNINSQLETKLRYFNELSNNLTCRLQSLVALTELGFGNKKEIKDFVEQITLSWVHTNKEVVKEYAGIRIASRTSAGTPLTSLANKIKKESSSVKVSLQIGSVIYDQDYVSRGYMIYDEILQILESLERCDDKVQQYLVICKTTPYLIELTSTVDGFVATSDLSPCPIKRADSTSDLAPFEFLAKLLTGELLAEETTDPTKILADNAPRKPVFITLNNKRKSGAPKILENKIFRSSTFPPSSRSAK